MLNRRVPAVSGVIVGTLVCVWLLSVGIRSRTPSPAAEQTASAERDAADAARHPRDDERIVSDAERLDALSRAHVWREPEVPVSRAKLARPETTPQSLTCRFRLGALGGTTSKFDCDVEGDKVRIKYGTGPELPAEAAATRLLHALGFGADEVAFVPRLRCHGCPAAPFVIAKVVEATHTAPLYEKALDYEDSHDFEWVVLERKFDARPIETEQLDGWSFHELDRIDQSKGGAPRAHVDALRLLAVFLAHWDNKAPNQRLVCLSRDWREGTPCRAPFAMIQDLGATFGPRKVDLEAWERADIFDDRARCRISMGGLPYDGATFDPVHIREAGRRHLGGLLSQLSDRQLTDLFAGARFDQRRSMFTDVHPVAEWVRVFKAKVHAITDGPSCPS
jgi:hypothetical protein